MTLADVDCVLEIVASLPNAPHWTRLTWLEVLALNHMPQRIALVAISGETNAVVGFAVAILVPPQAELEVIAIASPNQRRGLGHQLLAFLVEQVNQAGITEMLLEVRESNLAAISFYRSLGFKQIGNRAGYYADPVEDAVLMNLQVEICRWGLRF